jgi:hypothetical protein
MAAGFLPAAAIPEKTESMITKKRILVTMIPAMTARSILRKVFICMQVIIM